MPISKLHCPVRVVLLASALTVTALPVQALDDQWYIGLGGSVASLRPDAEEPGFDADEDPVAGATVFVGRDLDDRSSIQLQLHGLGEGSFESGETVDHAAGDASILYRFVDSRDGAPQGQVFGASLYGRLGVGVMTRDSDIELENDDSVYFGAGAGVEIYATNNIALRAEGIYHEEEAASANLSLVARFGGWSGRLPSAPLVDLNRPQPSQTTLQADTASDAAVTAAAPRTASENTAVTAVDEATPLPDPVFDALPATSPGAGASRSALDTEAVTGSSTANTSNTGAATRGAQAGDGVQTMADVSRDIDGDGITNDKDVCPQSAPGFPVLENGCALLDGVLSGLQFAPGTADFLPGTVSQLDYLASLLEDYPDTRIELIAHTDDAGTVRDQSIITRARLRALGTYLTLQKGIGANRLQLRSFGGTRPLHDNDTDEGRAKNNRIEVLENAS